MHFEILVEGQSDRTALEILMKKIVGNYKEPHTWRIHKHPGIGKLPSNTLSKPNPKDRTLLHNLPSKLRAYSKSLGANECVVVLVDLDDRPDCKAFKKQLLGLLKSCNPGMNCKIRIAIEEIEAWYLGDRKAVIASYPNADASVLDSYVQDSQCKTWEKLADAIYPGGLTELMKLGVNQRLDQKRIWAKDICPQMKIAINRSPSFRCFRDGIQQIAALSLL